MSTLSEVVVGTELPEVRVQVTRTQLVRYAGASGDFNPIHYSDFHASALGLPGVVAHGMLTMGMALRVVTDWTGDPAAVTSYFVRFTKPVPVPDDATGVEVVFGGTVTAIEDGIATVSITAVLGEERVLGAARAEVRLD